MRSCAGSPVTRFRPPTYRQQPHTFATQRTIMTMPNAPQKRAATGLSSRPHLERPRPVTSECTAKANITPRQAVCRARSTLHRMLSQEGGRRLTPSAHRHQSDNASARHPSRKKRLSPRDRVVGLKPDASPRVESDESGSADRLRARGMPAVVSENALVEVRHPHAALGRRANVLHAVPDREGALHPD